MYDIILLVLIINLDMAPVTSGCAYAQPINQLFNDELIAVQIIYFWMLIRGISHGFDGTQDSLVIALNF